MKDPTKTELVFEDLQRMHWDILNYRRFPRRFRLAFELYVYKSQQLTEAMRSEYKAKTGLKWVASDFEGWGVNSTAIKRIRNAAFHGNPIELEETVLSVYPVEPEVFHHKPLSVEVYKRGYFILKSQSFVASPFQEEFISANPGLPLVNKRVDDPKDVQNYLFPIRQFVGYSLNWNLLNLMSETETEDYPESDAIRLVLKSFPILRNYIIFYRQMLDKNEYDIHKTVIESEEDRLKRLAGLSFSDEGGSFIGGHHIPRLVNKES